MSSLKWCMRVEVGSGRGSKSRVGGVGWGGLFLLSGKRFLQYQETLFKKVGQRGRKLTPPVGGCQFASDKTDGRHEPHQVCKNRVEELPDDSIYQKPQNRQKELLKRTGCHLGRGIRRDYATRTRAVAHEKDGNSSTRWVPSEQVLREKRRQSFMNIPTARESRLKKSKGFGPARPSAVYEKLSVRSMARRAGGDKKLRDDEKSRESRERSAI